MKAFLSLLLLVGVSLDVASKCDYYFVGNIHYRRRSLGVDEDDKAVIQGCKKGCFWNATYTEDGVPKCLKCSEIKDETECLMHSTTCQWSKGGKCKSQSCPSMSKSRVSLFGPVAGGVVGDPNDNATLESQYRVQVIKEKECIEGSALEQKYNKLYLDDYLTATNDVAVWNLDDTCTEPGSTVGTGVYGWHPGPNAQANREACGKFIGYTYEPQTDPKDDKCERIDCTINPTIITEPPSPTQYKNACDVKPGCIYIRGTSVDGRGDDGLIPDDCVPASNDACTSGPGGTTRWIPGTNTPAECISTRGCVYRQGANMQLGNTDRLRNKDGLAITDTCIAGCTPFTPGMSTRKDCEVLGCTYNGGDNDNNRPGDNLRSFEDADLCPANKFPPMALESYCGVNSTLALDYTYDTDACNDRIYDNTRPFSCNITGLTTEETCINGHGTWTAPPKACRPLYSTARSICEFNERDRKTAGDAVNIGDLSNHRGGNQRPGTKYERCVQSHYDETDQVKTETVTKYDGQSGIAPAYLTLDDHERIYGYRTPEEYCKYKMELVLKQCQRTYETSVAGCHTLVTQYQVNVAHWTRTAVQVKAVRSACHRIYGCMYSKSNERCSVWAVWAFILTIVLSVVVFIVLLGVVAFVVIPILKRSSA